MATASKNPERLLFSGPAEQKFETFIELANSSYNTYSPCRKENVDNGTARSYLIPPIFKYKRPEKDDEAYRNERETMNTSPLIKDRQTDQAEQLVFDAIDQLCREGFQAPFIAIHNLNIDENHHRLSQLFPAITNWAQFEECFREYDFLLIGPKIGMLVIEVKHSSFTGKKHFVDDCKHLPERYIEGVKQLKTGDVLKDMLQQCANVKLPDQFRVRKILVTPNLERVRYQNWLDHLTKVDKGQSDQIRNKIADTIQWFKEDSLIRSETASLCSALRSVLEEKTEMPVDIFQAIGPIVAALASTTVLKSKVKKSEVHLTLSQPKLDEKKAVLEENVRIKSQKHSTDPIAFDPSDPNTIEMIVLNQDQLQAMNGPNRQFILGAAGTGKTIVLMAKIMKLINDKQSILVLSPDCFAETYRELFNRAGVSDYNVLWWLGDELKPFYEWCKNELKNDTHDYDIRRYNIEKYFNYIQNETTQRPQRMKKIFNWLQVYNHVFIDDALEGTNTSISVVFTCCCAIMAYSAITYPAKFVWIASDYYANKWMNLSPPWMDLTKLESDMMRNALFYGHKGNNDIGFCIVSVLRNVMRCSANVYENFYKPKDSWWPETEPLLIHTVRGKYVYVLDKICDSKADAVDYVWRNLKKEIERVSTGYKECDVAIIINPHIVYSNQLKEFFPDAQGSGEYQLVLNDREPSKLIAHGKKFSVYRWDNVCSLEWPVIIYAGFSVHLGGGFRGDFHEKYRALSRAIVEGTAISATYFDFIDKDMTPAVLDRNAHTKELFPISDGPSTSSMTDDEDSIDPRTKRLNQVISLLKKREAIRDRNIPSIAGSTRDTDGNFGNAHSEDPLPISDEPSTSAMTSGSTSFMKEMFREFKSFLKHRNKIKHSETTMGNSIFYDTPSVSRPTANDETNAFKELVSVKLSMLPNDASQRKVQRAIVELIDNALEAAEQGNNKASDDA